MHPPLANHAQRVIAVEHVVGPFGIGTSLRIGHLLELTSIGELADVARPVEWAIHHFHVLLLSGWPLSRPSR